MTWKMEQSRVFALSVAFFALCFAFALFTFMMILRETLKYRRRVTGWFCREVSEGIRRTAEQLDRSYAENRKIYERQKKLFGRFKVKKISIGIDLLLEQTGIKRKFRKIRGDVFLYAFLMFVLTVAVLTTMLTKEPVFGIMAAGIVISGVTMTLKSMLEFNIASVDKELVNFINLVINYSVTNDDITAIFGRIYMFFGEPLKSLLRQCYSEAKADGDKDGALMRLSERTGNYQFSILVQNLHMASLHSNDLDRVAVCSREVVRNYLAAKETRKNMAAYARLQIVAAVAAGIGICFFLQKITGVELQTLFFENSAGRFLMGICAAVIMIVCRILHSVSE